MALTAKQSRFVEEYLTDFNATQAATRAGYSEKTAYQTGHELLGKPEIVAAVDAARAKLSEKTLVTQADVVKGLLEEARFCGEGSSHSARVSAWAQLGKFTGGFSDKLEHLGKDGAALPVINFHLTGVVKEDE